MAGATGLVGREVLAALLADKRYTVVHAVGRRVPTVQHLKLHSHVTDLGASLRLPDIPQIDDVFIALGTTIRIAGSQPAFRAIDLDAVVALARSAKARGASKLGVVSSMGASPESSIFYSRVKGEMEAAVGLLGYRTLIIARPSMLDGDRASLTQAARPAEGLSLVAMRFFKPMIPANYQAITGAQVARALIHTLQTTDQGTRILLSGEMQRLT